MQYWAHVAAIFSAGAISLSAMVAFSAFIYTRWVNRRLTTFDMVMQTFMAEVGTVRYDNFRDVVRRDVDPNDDLNIVDMVALEERFKDERTAIIDQMNQYELISLGIHQRLFDEGFYKLWFHRQFVRDYRSLEPLIDEIQKAHPTRYWEFKKLYIRWSEDPELYRLPRRKMIWWVMTRNRAKLNSALVGINAKDSPNPARPPLI